MPDVTPASDVTWVQSETKAFTKKLNAAIAKVRPGAHDSVSEVGTAFRGLLHQIGVKIGIERLYLLAAMGKDKTRPAMTCPSATMGQARRKKTPAVGN